MTKAGIEFRQRGEDYQTLEDGNQFNNWYETTDINRILTVQHRKLDQSVKNEVIRPYVFFDTFQDRNMGELFNPLIETLKDAAQSYYPFVFKPEMGAAHYMSGFLRKDKLDVITIFVFNPTGTALRVNNGDFKAKVIESTHQVQTALKDGGVCGLVKLSKSPLVMSKNELQKIQNHRQVYALFEDKLYYINNVSLPVPVETNQLDALKGLFSEKVDVSTDASVDNLQQINAVTGHSPTGTLVSCGPLSTAFVEYIMSHPDYMAGLGKNFVLPESISALMGNDQVYVSAVQELRNKHAQFLDTVADDGLEDIDELNAKIVRKFLGDEEYDEYQDDDGTELINFSDEDLDEAKDEGSEIVPEFLDEAETLELDKSLEAARAREAAKALEIAKLLEEATALLEETKALEEALLEEALLEEEALEEEALEEAKALETAKGSEEAVTPTPEDDKANLANLDPVLDKELHKVRYNIARMKAKITDLQDDGKDTPASLAARTLCNELTDYADQYATKTIELDTFQTKSNDSINKARLELDKPRGHCVKHILANLAVAVATLFIGYAIWAACKGTFFVVNPNTDSTNIAEDVRDSVKNTSAAAG